MTNTLPEFAAETAERRIAENTPPGTPIGRPVTANDPDEEKLSYSLVEDSANAGDDDNFNIDPETGQLTVGMSLDFEEVVNGAGKQEYVFQVRATDSRAGSTGGTDNCPCDGDRLGH